MDKGKHGGAITVYLSIILSAVIILSGVLMDIVRIKAAEVQTRRAANTAIVSALALYNTKLKKEYGLFALSNNDSQFLQEDIKYYMENQLVTKGNITDGIYLDQHFKKVDFINLFDYRIESIDILPIYNLTENEITRQQIIEYMKYRAPAQLAENFMDKLDYAASAEAFTSAYKQKTMIEKKLGNVDKSMRRLQEAINQINKFIQAHYDSSPDSNSELIALCKGLVLYEVYHACMQVDLSMAPDASQGGEKQEQVSEFMDSITGLFEDSAENIRYHKSLLEEQLINCFDAIKEAQGELEYIMNTVRQVQQDVDELQYTLDGLKAQDTKDTMESSSFLSAIQKDIDKYQSLIDGNRSHSMTGALSANLQILNILRDGVSSLQSWIASESGDIAASAVSSIKDWLRDGSAAEILDYSQYSSLINRLVSSTRLRSMEDKASQYQLISDVLVKNSNSKGSDPRKGVSKAAAKIIDEKKDAAISIVIEHPSLLPSYFFKGSFPNKIFSEGVVDSQDYYNDEPRWAAAFDADFDEESSFASNGFDFISNFANKLKSDILFIRDEIYVNEYILKTFKDAVEIKDCNTDGKISSPYFDQCEVEYIIGGNTKEKINEYLVKGQILLIRFGMNTLHVYTDPQKRLKALETAAAVAGFTGFGIPIVHNLIMCAWGTAEGLLDVKTIYQGEKVPFLKTAENWQTDLLPTGFKSKENRIYEEDMMDFDYHDYLRLLLLAQSREIKMNRIQDLIQLNMQKNIPSFTLNSCNTYIKINAQISIKYWSVIKLFLPSRLQTQTGRHIVNVEVWRGY